jgi:hypothetical protein
MFPGAGENRAIDRRPDAAQGRSPGQEGSPRGAEPSHIKQAAPPPEHATAEPTNDDRLISEVLEEVRTHLGSLEGMRDELREGFRSVTRVTQE